MVRCVFSCISLWWLAKSKQCYVRIMTRVTMEFRAKYSIEGREIQHRSCIQISISEQWHPEKNVSLHLSPETSEIHTFYEMLTIGLRTSQHCLLSTLTFAQRQVEWQQVQRVLNYKLPHKVILGITLTLKIHLKLYGDIQCLPWSSRPSSFTAKSTLYSLTHRWFIITAALFFRLWRAPFLCTDTVLLLTQAFSHTPDLV